ncbi:MAG TPA: DHA2 family efflux MFS transporter permease subunit [Chloroflexota bacterium]|nr:DHA2 family efflux MFS transporter permease subunit [Chloroflexota bacterium]
MGPGERTGATGRRIERAVREPAPLRWLARRPAYPWFVVGTVCIGAFMGQLDASIAQLVLPTLETTFHARLSAVDWVALAYLLALAGSLPIFGRLADMVGRKLLYTGGFLVFVAGSALCGFAPTLGFLIGARIFQAIGAGLLQANSVAIITVAAGPRHRGRAIGLQGAAQAIGLSVGPALGGLLIQVLGWRWVFWIAVPAGLLGAALGWLVLPRTAGLRRDQPFDVGGALLLAPGLTALLLAVNEGRRWGWTSAPLLVCAVAGALLLALFVWHERRTPSPLIDLRLFDRPVFSAGNLAGLLSYGILFAIFFLLPFALERGYGQTPLQAGLLLSAVPLALGLVAPLSGRLSDKIGARPLTVAGMLVAAGALVALAQAISGRGATLPGVVAALAAFGLGQGLFTAPNNSAIMGAAPAERLGVAGGLLNVTRTLGTSLGVAVATVVFADRLAAAAGRAISTVTAPRGAVLAGVHDTLLLFAALAMVAAGISLVRGAAGSVPGTVAERPRGARARPPELAGGE